MTTEYRTAGPPVQWGLAASPKPGETVLGDAYIVRPFPGGILLAVVDGIGHGVEACQAAQKACGVLAKDPSASPMELLQRCHTELEETRGVVMSLASVDYAGNKMQWAGVGNVDGTMFHSAVPRSQTVLIRKNGTVGHQLPTLEVTTVPLARGDVIVFATDGIQEGYTEKIFPKYAPQQIANQVLEDFSNKRDDALVLVVRYLGQSMP